MLKQEPISTFHEAQYLDRGIRGAIVNTASLSGLITLSDFAGYASSKHGVTMMTRQLAREYAPHKIRVNSVCPGIVRTNMVTETGLTQEFLDGLSRQAPMNRWIHADEVAEATLFLCSSQASAVTGVNLPVDCGATLYHSM
jgi:NAD(P)-dependent dehydrogenase (short-subunit alcohol dehydrogenase family)